MTNVNNPGNNPEYKKRNIDENVEGVIKIMKKLVKHETIIINWKVSSLWMSSSKSDVKLSSFSYLFPIETENTFVSNEFDPNHENMLLICFISLLETNWCPLSNFLSKFFCFQCGNPVDNDSHGCTSFLGHACAVGCFFSSCFLTAFFLGGWPPRNQVK